MYYTIRDNWNKFHGEFETRKKAEEYQAYYHLTDCSDIVLVDYKFLLNCLLDILYWYAKDSSGGDDLSALDAGASIEATLEQFEAIFGLSPLNKLSEPDDDPLYQPILQGEAEIEALENRDEVLLEAWTNGLKLDEKDSRIWVMKPER